MKQATGFPILDEAATVPWDFVRPHEGQARRNHYQTLDRLAARGGLSWLELYAVVTDRDFATIRHMTKVMAKEAVQGLLTKFEEQQLIKDRRFKCLEDVLAHNSELNDVAREAWFLIQRLEEFEPELPPIEDGQDHVREYYGHVHPSVARLKDLIAKVNQDPTGKGFMI